MDTEKRVFRATVELPADVGHHERFDAFAGKPDYGDHDLGGLRLHIIQAVPDKLTAEGRRLFRVTVDVHGSSEALAQADDSAIAGEVVRLVSRQTMSHFGRQYAETVRAEGSSPSKESDSTRQPAAGVQAAGPGNVTTLDSRRARPAGPGGASSASR